MNLPHSSLGPLFAVAGAQAALGGALVVIALVVGVRAAAFGPRLRIVLLCGSGLMLEGLLQFLFWAAASDPEIVDVGMPWEYLAVLGALALLIVPSAVIWRSRIAWRQTIATEHPTLGSNER